MEMTGHYRIEAPRDKVWEALNDPDVLRASIPGCEELTRTGENSFAAKVRARVGPINARFNGEVKLTDIVPPESYRIGGEGKGGAAGFAKGGARVRLEEEGSATILHYDVEASVGGKMAQLGARLIDGTAKKMADDFFANFGRQVAGAPAETLPGAEEAPAEAAPPPPQGQPAAAIEARAVEAGALDAGASPADIRARSAQAGGDAARTTGQRAMRPLSWILLVAAILLLLLIVLV